MGNIFRIINFGKRLINLRTVKTVDKLVSEHFGGMNSSIFESVTSNISNHAFTNPIRHFEPPKIKSAKTNIFDHIRNIFRHNNSTEIFKKEVENSKGLLSQFKSKVKKLFGHNIEKESNKNLKKLSEKSIHRKKGLKLKKNSGKKEQLRNERKFFTKETKSQPYKTMALKQKTNAQLKGDIAQNLRFTSQIEHAKFIKTFSGYKSRSKILIRKIVQRGSYPVRTALKNVSQKYTTIIYKGVSKLKKGLSYNYEQFDRAVQNTLKKTVKTKNPFSFQSSQTLPEVSEKAVLKEIQMLSAKSDKFVSNADRITKKAIFGDISQKYTAKAKLTEKEPFSVIGKIDIKKYIRLYGNKNAFKACVKEYGNEKTVICVLNNSRVTNKNCVRQAIKWYKNNPEKQCHILPFLSKENKIKLLKYTNRSTLARLKRKGFVTGIWDTEIKELVEERCINLEGNFSKNKYHNLVA